jgi:hypothetical protein
MDLYGNGGSFRWVDDAWYQVLAMAKICGWKPMAVTVLEGGNRNDTAYYLYNRGQWVSDEDAGNMAVALKRSLAPAMQKKLKARKRSPFDLWFFKKGGVGYLKEFIAFLEAGKFRIN